MLTVDELIATLDSDGDRKVSKAEWVANLDKCVGNPRSFGIPELRHMLSTVRAVRVTKPNEQVRA